MNYLEKQKLIRAQNHLMKVIELAGDKMAEGAKNEINHIWEYLDDLSKPKTSFCLVCNREYIIAAKGREQKYCSNACKMRDFRRKQKFLLAEGGKGASCMQ